MNPGQPDHQAKLDFIHRAAALAGVPVTYRGGLKKMPRMQVWKGRVKIEFLYFMVDNRLEAWAKPEDAPHRDVFSSLPDHQLTLAQTLQRWRDELATSIRTNNLTDFHAITYLSAVLQDTDPPA